MTSNPQKLLTGPTMTPRQFVDEATWRWLKTTPVVNPFAPPPPHGLDAYIAELDRKIIEGMAIPAKFLVWDTRFGSR